MCFASLEASFSKNYFVSKFIKNRRYCFVHNLKEKPIGIAQYKHSYRRKRDPTNLNYIFTKLHLQIELFKHLLTKNTFVHLPVNYDHQQETYADTNHF